MALSRNRRKRIPIQKPANAGTKASLPLSADWAIAGTRRLHIEAATMTPAAKPERARSTEGLMFLFRRNTRAEPAVVPINGIIRIRAIFSMAVNI